MQALIQHALDTVWCNSLVDRYHNIGLTRVSGVNGFAGMVPEPWGLIPLPAVGSFQVYTLGGITFSRLGLPNYEDGWVNMAECATVNGIEMTVLTQSGVTIPAGEVFFHYGVDNSMLVAIRRSDLLDGMLDDELRYINYANPSTYTDGHFYTNSRIITHRDDVLLIYNEFLEASKLGVTTLFRNGYVVEDTIHPNDVIIKDSLHYECRTYAKCKKEFALSDLPRFNSEVDGIPKYLLHLPSNDESNIHFYNDLTLHLLQKQGDKVVGIELYPSRESDFRMVTHHDVAISKALIDRYIAKLPKDFTPTHLSVIIRSDGMGRKMWYDVNYVNELYKLDEEHLLKELCTDQGVIPEWHMAKLEQCSINRVMEKIGFDIGKDDIVEGYGYNGVVQALERSPVVMAHNEITQRLPPLLSRNSTFFTYDGDGVFKGVERGFASSITVGGGVRTVDGLFGELGDKPSYEYNAQVTQLNREFDYRMYKADTSDGPHNGKWVPGVAGEDYFISNGRITWTLNLNGWDVLVLCNRVWPYLTLTVKEDVLHFDLTEELSKAVGFTLPYDLYAHFELWQDDNRLIQGVDYVINDGVLFIQSKDFFSRDAEATSESEFKLLYTGFSGPNRELGLVGDTGFIRNGEVSANHRYNLVEGLNGVVISDGKVFAREDVILDGEPQGSQRRLLTGRPYQFYTRTAVTNGLDWERDREYHKSRDLAHRIETYFTSLADKTEYKVIPIDRMYALVSVTLNRIIRDIKDYRVSALPATATDEELKGFLSAYQLEIDNDVALKDWGKDEDFVDVHPHALYHFVGLSEVEFHFLQRVNQHLFKGKVNLSRYVNIGRL